MVELLVALAIFSLAAAIAAGSFWSITKAWTRGGEMLEQLHYGEFAMDQLVTALRGAAWFSSKPEAFGFWLDDSGGTSKDAANHVSWVTSGTAFLPPDSPLQNGLHRLSLTVEGSGDERGLTVRAWPHLSEEIGESDVDSWLVAPGVEGFSCEWYDFEDESWSQDWEETNSLPKLLRITLTMQERKEFDENLELVRLVELEVAPELPGRERRDRTTGTTEEQPSEGEGGAGGSAGGGGAAGGPGGGGQGGGPGGGGGAGAGGGPGGGGGRPGSANSGPGGRGGGRGDGGQGDGPGSGAPGSKSPYLNPWGNSGGSGNNGGEGGGRPGSSGGGSSSFGWSGGSGGGVGGRNGGR